MNKEAKEEERKSGEREVEGGRETVEVNSEGTCLDMGCLAKNSRSSVPFVTWRVLGIPWIFLCVCLPRLLLCLW